MTGVPLWHPQHPSVREAHFIAGRGSSRLEEIPSSPSGALLLLTLAFRQIPVVSQGPQGWERDSGEDTNCLWLWHTPWQTLSAVVTYSFSVEISDLSSPENWWWWWWWWPWGEKLWWDNSLQLEGSRVGERVRKAEEAFKLAFGRFHVSFQNNEVLKSDRNRWNIKLSWEK